jgi:hypothetical protein
MIRPSPAFRATALFLTEINQRVPVADLICSSILLRLNEPAAWLGGYSFIVARNRPANCWMGTRTKARSLWVTSGHFAMLERCPRSGHYESYSITEPVLGRYATLMLGPVILGFDDEVCSDAYRKKSSTATLARTLDCAPPAPYDE